MNIINQLVQFIFQQREVKDVDYSPTAAVILVIADALPLLLMAIVVGEQSYQFGDITIKNIPVGVAVLYPLVFLGLFYALFAAKERQARFVQASTSFFGSSFILTLVNSVIALIPGAGFLTFFIIGLKISCSVRVTMQALDYSILRSVFALLGITLMAMIVATTVFPIEAVQTTATSSL